MTLPTAQYCSPPALTLTLRDDVVGAGYILERQRPVEIHLRKHVQILARIIVFRLATGEYHVGFDLTGYQLLQAFGQLRSGGDEHQIPELQKFALDARHLFGSLLYLLPKQVSELSRKITFPTFSIEQTR